MDKKMKILWLSDFHFSKDLKTKNNYFDEFVDSFLMSLNEYRNQITHVIFTGDISLDGNAQAYNVFQEKFFEKLLVHLGTHVKYLIIPGNHDVEWAKYNTAYEDFIKESKVEHSFEKFFSFNSEKLKYLKEHKEDYFSTFYAFIENIESCCRNKKRGSVYSKTFYDKEYQVLFLLINSALNSFGDVPRKAIDGKLKYDIIQFGYEACLKDIINEKSDLFNQHGQQTYLLDDLDNELTQIESEIGLSNYELVSIAHHNYDWLHRSEIFSDKPNVEPPIEHLFKISKLHLTGHEHAKPSHGLAYNNCTILRSGMFFDSIAFKKPKKDEKFPNNWYSLLSFSNKEMIHEVYNYFYSDGTYKWERHDPFKYLYKPNGIHNILHNYSTSDHFLNQVTQIRHILGEFETVENKEWERIEQEHIVEFYNHESINGFITDNLNRLKEELLTKGLSIRPEDLCNLPYPHILDHKQEQLITFNLLEYSLRNEEDAINKIIELYNLYFKSQINYRIVLVEIYKVNFKIEKYQGSKICEKLKERVSKEVKVRNQAFELFEYKAEERLKEKLELEEENDFTWLPINLLLFEHKLEDDDIL
jgi:hypothetical protein